MENLKCQQLIRAGLVILTTFLVIVGFIYSAFLGNKSPDLQSIIKITDTIARIAYINGNGIEENQLRTRIFASIKWIMSYQGVNRWK